MHIRDFVEWQLEHYPESKRQLEQCKDDMIPSVISQYGPRAGGHSDPESRPTEDTAMRIATDTYIRQLEFTVNAIGFVLNKLTEEDTKLISMVYWKERYTVQEAADFLCMHKSTAYRHLNDIFTLIALELGYTTF